MNKLFSNIKGDAFGGITAGVVALPLALAFGVSSGLGPSAGLYGAIFISFFAALFGGTNTQISGPTAPMTAVSMVVIAGIIAENEGSVGVSSEVLIMLTVLLLSTFWDLIFAVGIGLLISCLMFMKLIGDLTAQRTKLEPLKLEPLKEEAWPDEMAFPTSLKNEVFIKHIKGPLFFGYTAEFQQLYKQIPNRAKTVVIRLSRMQYIDQTGLYVVEDMLQDLKAKGITVVLVGLLDQPRFMMERIDIIPGFIPENQIFDTFKDYLNVISK